LLTYKGGQVRRTGKVISANTGFGEYIFMVQKAINSTPSWVPSHGINTFTLPIMGHGEMVRLKTNWKTGEYSWAKGYMPTGTPAMEASTDDGFSYFRINFTFRGRIKK
jgi:hypothetical protein